MKSNYGLPPLTAQWLITNNKFFGKFFETYFNEWQGATDQSANAATKTFLQFANSSHLLRDILAVANAYNVTLVVTSLPEGTNGKARRISEGVSEVQISQALVAAAATGDATAVAQFTMSLSHELGHALGGKGLPGFVKPTETESADAYARRQIYDAEGIAAAFSTQVALELMHAGPGIWPDGVSDSSVPNLLSAIATNYQTQESLEADAYELDVRQRVSDYHFTRRPPEMGNNIQRKDSNTYYETYVQLYAASRMGLACGNYDFSSLMVVKGADFSGTDWTADFIMNSYRAYRFDARKPNELSIVENGVVRGTKPLLKNVTCQFSDIQTLTAKQIGYIGTSADGSSFLSSADQSLPAGASDSVIAITEADEWLEYNVYDGDNGISIKLAEGGKLVFDEASSSKAFYVKRPSEAQPNVELGAVGGAAVGVGSDDYTSIIVSRPGIGELPLGTLLANDDTQASFFAAANGGELRGLVDATNTIHGYGGNDTLFGGAKADVLYGSLGNDTLDGGAGADHMEGGLDDDTYFVDDVGDQVDELANQGYDTVKVHQGALSSGSYLLQANVEAGELLADAGNAKLYGNELDNQLKGNAGNNWLDGGAGADRMEGGAGDDYYIVDNAADQVIELDGAGNDTVQVYVSGYFMQDHVEKLQFFATGAPQAMVTGHGNNQANEMAVMSNQYASLYGWGGNDTMYAGSAGSYLHGGAGNDKLYGSSGRDNLNGQDGGEFDELYGGDGIDNLFGDGDYVNGGAGDDTLGSSMVVGSTFEWGVGDGRDTVRAGHLDTIKFTGSGYALTATLSGPDLILTTDGRNGTVLKNWTYSSFTKPTIELPDGRRITGAEMSAMVHPAVMGWKYSSGEFAGGATNLKAAASSISDLVTLADSLWVGSTGWSMFDAGWQSGFQYASQTGRFQGKYAIYHWGVGGGGFIPGRDGNDIYSAINATLEYDFWQTDSGSYEFAFTSMSTWYGGQTTAVWNQETQEWMNYTLPRVYDVSATYGSYQVALTPAVTSALLYDPLTAANASQVGASATLYGSIDHTTGASSKSVASLAEYDAMVHTQDLVLAPVGDGQLDFVYGDSWLHLGPTSSAHDVEANSLDAANADSFGRETRVSVMPVPVNDFRLVA